MQIEMHRPAVFSPVVLVQEVERRTLAATLAESFQRAAMLRKQFREIPPARQRGGDERPRNKIHPDSARAVNIFNAANDAPQLQVVKSANENQ